MGLRSTAGRGSGKSSKDVHKKLEEKVGLHSSLPTVLPFVSTLAFVYRHVGGVSAAIEAARLVAEKDERFKQIVYMYDECPESSQHKLKLEVLCQQAGVTQGDFIGMTMAAMHERNLDIGNMIASAAHPRVVEATIENAQRTNGFMDRQMLHQHTGFIPTAKGTSIVIDNSKKTLNAGGGTIQQIPTAEGGPTRLGMPSFEDETMSATRAIRGDAGMGAVGQKQLPAPSPEQAVVVPTTTDIQDAEFVDVQPSKD